MPKDFVFDPELGTFVPSAKTMEEIDESALQIVLDPVDTEFVAEQEDDDSFEENAGGDNQDILHAPDTFYVLSQTVRTNPDGSTVVDVIIQVDDDSDFQEYGVRISK